MKLVLFAPLDYGLSVFQALTNGGHDVPLAFIAKSKYHDEAKHFFETVDPNKTTVFTDVDPMHDVAAFARIEAEKPDVLVVISEYPISISTHVQRLAQSAVYLHPSLLPHYRGPSAAEWALIEGERTTGVTLAKLARQNDAGEIILQSKIEIAPEDDGGSLRAKLATEMANVLAHYCESVANGVIQISHPQPINAGTTYPEILPRDGHIRFDQSTARVLNRIRGANPQPGAYTDVGQEEYRILRAVAHTDLGYSDEPGKVLSVENGEMTAVIKTLDGSVRVWLDGQDRALAENQASIFAGRKTPFTASQIVGSKPLTIEMPSEEELNQFAQFPDMVVLAVAYPCNAHCPNCPYSPESSDIRESYGDAQFMSPELFMKVADECGLAARNNWLPGGVGGFIRITGGGEPMLHPYGMTKLIEYAMHAGARVYLNTNGSLLKDDDINRLLACNIDNIEISVDAADRDTYAIVRKGLDCDNLIATVKKLVARRNETKSKTTLEVSVINQQIVAGTIEEIEAFWYDLGIDNVIVRKFLTWGSSTTIDPNHSADPIAYLDRDAKVPCPDPFHRLSIDSRGKVEVCSFDIIGRTNMGNALESSIRDIWRGTMYEWWREKHRSGRGGDIPLCAECPDWKYRSWSHNYRKALTNAKARREDTLTKV